jgi:ABC-type multidrug transport system permease subunit
MIARLWAILVARNKEFLRDRGALGWNLIFPFMVVFGFAYMFTVDDQDVFKVGVVGELNHPFSETQHVQFIPSPDREAALAKLGRHQLDMVFAGGEHPRYWVNSTSPKGYLLERILWGSSQGDRPAKETVEGAEIRYIDWLMPGLLGMNMMFSCLFGVGYVIVRYRKNGVLRRFKATPVTAFEFLTAQVGSRLLLVLAVTLIIYVGSYVLIDFQMAGSYLALFLVFALGAASLISLGLLVAARTASEELAGGLLNLVSWPMMFMSEVWFSLEGSPEWVKIAAKLFPLTHVTKAGRAIMTEGATTLDVLPELGILAGMSLGFGLVGAWLFRWE